MVCCLLDVLGLWAGWGFWQVAALGFGFMVIFRFRGVGFL